MTKEQLANELKLCKGEFKIKCVEDYIENIIEDIDKVKNIKVDNNGITFNYYDIKIEFIHSESNYMLLTFHNTRTYRNLNINNRREPIMVDAFIDYFTKYIIFGR